jgi:hypothetical protein
VSAVWCAVDPAYLPAHWTADIFADWLADWSADWHSVDHTFVCTVFGAFIGTYQYSVKSAK